MPLMHLDHTLEKLRPTVPSGHERHGPLCEGGGEAVRDLPADLLRARPEGEVRQYEDLVPNLVRALGDLREVEVLPLRGAPLVARLDEGALEEEDLRLEDLL